MATIFLDHPAITAISVMIQRLFPTRVISMMIDTLALAATLHGFVAAAIASIKSRDSLE